MSNLDSIIKDINKKFDTEIGFKGTKRSQGLNLIPFSSLRASYLLYGGIPRGRITEFCGEESSGKTTTALDIVANAQKIFCKEDSNKKIIYIDTENTLDTYWAENLGVNVEDIYIIQPQEQTAEQIFDMILDLIKTGEVGLVVLDSVATMVSQGIYDESMEKKSYCGISAPLTMFCNKVVPLLHKFDTTMIIINQVREDLNNPYNQYTTPGGKGFKHHCSVRLMFRKEGFFNEEGKDVNQSYENPAGHRVKISVLKTKTCSWNRKLGFYTLNYLEGVDKITDLIDIAIKFGYINKAGAWFSLIDNQGEIKKDSEGNLLKFQGVPKLIKYLKELPQDEFENLYSELYELICKKEG